MLGLAVDTDEVQLTAFSDKDRNRGKLTPVVVWQQSGEMEADDPAIENRCKQWHRMLSRGKIIDSTDRSFLPREKKCLENAGISTILMVPVFTSAEYWGSISFINRQKERVWLDAEKEALRTAAEILGAALEKQAAEQELMENRATAWTLLNAPRTSIVLLDREGLLISVNEQAAAAVGLKQSEIIGKHWSSVFPVAEQILNHERNIAAVFETGTSKHSEWSFQNSWVQSDFYPILINDSEVSSIAIFLRDITESRNLQKAVERRNQELQSLNSIMASAASYLAFPEILQVLRDNLQQSLDVYGGLIIFGDPFESGYNPDLGWGLPQSTYRETWQYVRENWKNWQNQDKPFIVDISKTIHIAGSVQSQELYGIPLRSQDKLQGYIVIVSDKQQDEEKLNHLLFYHSLSQQVGIAIHNAMLLEEIRKSQEHLQTLTSEVVRAREAERRRVARELHDEAGQALTALKIGLEILKTEDDLNSDAAGKRLDEAVALADGTMEHIRLLARDLRPPELEALGLDKSLDNACEEFERRTGIQTTYTGEGLEDIGDEVAISLYRFLQEALTNVARHASANSVIVSFKQEKDHTVLEVRDDGCGFDVDEVFKQREEGRRIDLTGMKERLELIGGTIRILSAPQRGSVPEMED
jgi:PAS domain S-box-containing protein